MAVAKGFLIGPGGVFGFTLERVGVRTDPFAFKCVGSDKTLFTLAINSSDVLDLVVAVVLELDPVFKLATDSELAPVFFGSSIGLGFSLEPDTGLEAAEPVVNVDKVEDADFTLSSSPFSFPTGSLD